MSGGNYSRINTRTTGATIVGSDDDADFDNIIANSNPAGVAAASDNDAAMQATRDPYPGEAISKPTSLAGELQGLRFLLKQITGKDQWYFDPDTSLLLQFNKGADIASATALPIGAATDGNYFDITGTTTITSITTRRVGDVVRLHFDGVLLLTHHATDLVLPGGANITTIAGDEAVFIEYATGEWRMVNYEPYLSANTTGTGDKVRATSPTIITPTIASLANMNHDHTDAAGGGLLTSDLGNLLSTDLTISGSAASPPDSNTITKENIIKAWAHVTYSGGTPTLADNFNISGIVDTGVGLITLQWDTDFANATYAITGAGQPDTGVTSAMVVSVDAAGGNGLTTADADMAIEDPTGTLDDPGFITFIAIGDQ